MIKLIGVGKKAITRKWLQTEPPSVEDWLQIMSEIFDMEKMTANLRMKGDIFNRRWDKWLLYELLGPLGRLAGVMGGSAASVSLQPPPT